jgi:hypothetical protein
MKMNFMEVNFDTAYTTIANHVRNENYVRVQLYPDGSIIVVINHYRHQRYYKLDEFENNDQRFEFVKLAHSYCIKQTIDDDIFKNILPIRSLKECMKKYDHDHNYIIALFESYDIFLQCNEINKTLVGRVQHAIFWKENIIITESDDDLIKELEELKMLSAIDIDG